MSNGILGGALPPHQPPPNQVGCGLQVVGGKGYVILQTGAPVSRLDPQHAIAVGVELIAQAGMAMQPAEVLRKIALELDSSIVLAPASAIKG